MSVGYAISCSVLERAGRVPSGRRVARLARSRAGVGACSSTNISIIIYVSSGCELRLTRGLGAPMSAASIVYLALIAVGITALVAIILKVHGRTKSRPEWWKHLGE